MSETIHKNTLEARHAALGTTWARLPKAGERLEGLSRSYLYELLTANLIRSHVIKRRHCIKGIRLIHLPSLRAYIEKEAVGEASLRASGTSTLASTGGNG
ncbi:MAG: hypothetical protein JNM99_09495 [Verrucomicrobiaceae bacterium]|nr:hypothetical protein [Verrucomicrobiaceae bacterium]